MINDQVLVKSSVEVLKKNVNRWNHYLGMGMGTGFNDDDEEEATRTGRKTEREAGVRILYCSKNDKVIP